MPTVFKMLSAGDVKLKRSQTLLSNSLSQELPDFFYKRPGRTYFRLCRSYDLCNMFFLIIFPQHFKNVITVLRAKVHIDPWLIELWMNKQLAVGHDKFYNKDKPVANSS